MDWFRVQTNPMQDFSVAPLPEDIFQPAGVTNWLMIALWAGLGALILALVFSLLVWWIVRGGKGKRPPRLSSPSKEALARIEKIRSDLRNVPARSVADEMGDAVKMFLSRKLGLDLVSRTGGEFIGRRDEWEHKLSPDFASWVVEFLNACDRLKFSGAEATEFDKRRLIEQATSTIKAFEPAGGGKSEP